MLATDVIKRPLVTEKATIASNELHRYAFQVDPRATKTEIRQAVEELYKVRVVSVATQNRKGRVRRFRYGPVQLPTVKRAVVKIHHEDKIELF
ncbi:MAG: 50S ribosomal protein L23 [Phycisphaerales bacterium]